MHVKRETYFWTESVCCKYKIVAAAFGYGPLVAAENFCSLNGITIRNWKANYLDESSHSNRYLLNFGVSQYKSSASFRVWVDCLMWLRQSLPIDILNYDLILSEEFFPIKDSLRKTLREFRRIPPLINIDKLKNPCLPKSSEKRLLLASFGGVQTPYSTERIELTIPQMVVELLSKIVMESDIDTIVKVCLPPRLKHHLALNDQLRNIEFLSPSRAGYISMLKKADIVVLQPGLYGPFEAFYLRKNVLFIPPFSYTQIMQEKEYLKYGLAQQTLASKFIESKINTLSSDIEIEEPKVFNRLDSLLKLNSPEIKERLKIDLGRINQFEQLTHENLIESSSRYVQTIFATLPFDLNEYINE